MNTRMNGTDTNGAHTTSRRAFTKATQELLRPIKLGETDKLRITIDKSLEHFVVHAYRTHETTETPKEIAAASAEVSRAITKLRATLANEWHAMQTVVASDRPAALAHITELESRAAELEAQVAKLNDTKTTRVERVRAYVQDHAWLERVPERKQVSAGDHSFPHWELAATDITVQVISAVWPRERLDFDDDARQVFDYLLLTLDMQERCADSYARYRERRDWLKAMQAMGPVHAEMARDCAPALECIGRITQHHERPLSLYQQVGLYNATRSEGFGLFMEQGTGKTPVAISEICELTKRAEFSARPVRILVVCPKNVRQNWFRELCNFATVPGEATILRGTQIKRVTQLVEAFTLELDSKFTVVICSYETIERSWQTLKHIQWDACYLDEAHYIKDTRTKRAKRMLELRENCARRRVLTGTPICNTPLDLYMQFEFMGKGFSGFSSWDAWRKFYGVYENRGGYNSLVAVQNLPFMQERLARLSYQVRKEEALPDLPPLVTDVLEVEMTEAQATAYETLSKQLALEIETDLAEGNKALVINNVLTKLLRLAQITSGFVSWDPAADLETGLVSKRTDHRHIEHFTPNPKLELLVSELKEMRINQPNAKAIVWACWQPDILSISARLEAEGIKHVTFYGQTSDADRAEAERAFNFDPETTVFLANPAAGGTGLNLLGYPPGDPDAATTNVERVFHYSQGWSSVVRSQADARPHRRGTRVNIRVTDLCVANTIDEQIRERVLSKMITAMQVSDIRAILNAVLHGVERDED